MGKKYIIIYIYIFLQKDKNEQEQKIRAAGSTVLHRMNRKREKYVISLNDTRPKFSKRFDLFDLQVPGPRYKYIYTYYI